MKGEREMGGSENTGCVVSTSGKRSVVTEGTTTTENNEETGLKKRWRVTESYVK